MCPLIRNAPLKRVGAKRLLCVALRSNQIALTSGLFFAAQCFCRRRCGHGPRPEHQRDSPLSCQTRPPDRPWRGTSNRSHASHCIDAACSPHASKNNPASSTALRQSSSVTESGRWTCSLAQASRINRGHAIRSHSCTLLNSVDLGDGVRQSLSFGSNRSSFNHKNRRNRSYPPGRTNSDQLAVTSQSGLKFHRWLLPPLRLLRFLRLASPRSKLRAHWDTLRLLRFLRFFGSGEGADALPNFAPPCGCCGSCGS